MEHVLWQLGWFVNFWLQRTTILIETEPYTYQDGTQAWIWVANMHGTSCDMGYGW